MTTPHTHKCTNICIYIYIYTWSVSDSQRLSQYNKENYIKYLPVHLLSISQQTYFNPQLRNKTHSLCFYLHETSSRTQMTISHL